MRMMTKVIRRISCFTTVSLLFAFRCNRSFQANYVETVSARPEPKKKKKKISKSKRNFNKTVLD